ncbi:uncharacterized protein LOC111031273 [Myzus persicae]|uniref:uncharacterized protein LOC111031273 n=1 Tax=Myzus persicae TaxID=13164 RepID=UPI000B938303|nr:uncharacterized protein LOC111031273 [Myzus persicae]
MGSKLKKREKNHIYNHGEHSTRFNTKRVMQMNNEHMFIKECAVHLAPPIIMRRLKKHARKLPETIEGLTFGVNQRYPKRRKIEHYQEDFIKSDYIGPFNVKHLTRNSINIFRKFRFKSKIYNTKRSKTPLHFLKLNPDIVLDFIKYPSVDKISKLLDLMYTESIQFKKYTIGLVSRQQSRQMSIDLKKYLFELCYQKFCELWMHKTPRIPVLSLKQFKRFKSTLLRHSRCRTTICNMSLKKLILYNGGLTGYPKKPHLVLCINIICSFFNTISRKCFRMLSMRYKKKANCKGYKNEITSIKLYHKGTTKRKQFLEIIDEYKHLMNVDRLSPYQVADIKHAYENILEPGQCIDKVDLETCANENYDFNRFQDGTKINHTIISEDLNTINNDDFDLDDIDRTPASVLKFLYNTPTPEIDNCFKADKFPKHDLKFFKEIQSRNFFNRKKVKHNMETTKDNSKNRSTEAIVKPVHVQCTSNENHNIENETLRHSSREVKPFIDCLEQKRTAIVDQDMDIPTVDLERTVISYSGEGTSYSNYLELERPTNTLEMQCISSNNCLRLSERHENTLLSHQIKLNKLEKRTLSIIMYSDVNLYKINWKRYPPGSRTRLFQILVYIGSFKMALCDKLNLDFLGLRENNICDMIDIDKLLRSIQTETCLQQEYFTFTEVENFLIWPLGKVIVNNIISQRSPTINILFSFVKNIITKFCEKVKDFLQKSGLRIVLNKESLFESLSNVQIGHDGHNTKLSLKYAHAHGLPSCSANNDAPESSNSEHFRVTNTGFCIKKNSSNEEICKSMVDILKSDDSIHQSWKECNNSHRFISKLLKAGVTLPIEESNTGHGSKFVEVYVRWFCEEYLQDDKFYKLAVSIFKNIFLYIDTASGCTDIKIEAAINNALMILYDQPCFAKAYESYLNTKYPKCLSSSKHNCNNDKENHSDFKGVNIRAIEKLQIEPNVNVQMDPMDTNDVGMSLVTCNLSTSNELDIINNVTINNLVTPDTQSLNDDFENVFIPDFKDLMNANNEITSNGLIENIKNFDENNLYDGSVTNDLNLMDIDVPNYNNQNFNEDHPFDDDILFDDNHFNDLISLETYSSNAIFESDSELQQCKKTNNLSAVFSFDYYNNQDPAEEEFNLQFQQSKNTEEVSMISSELVNFDLNDQINLNDLNMADDYQYGFYNAGVLLPP